MVLLAGVLYVLNYFELIRIGDLFLPIRNTTSVKAIPPNASVILSFKGIDQRITPTSNSDFFKDLNTIGPMLKLDRGLSFLDSLLSLQAENEEGKGLPVIASLHLISAKDYDFLYLLSPESSTFGDDDLDSYFKGAGIEFDKSRYEQVDLYHLVLEEGATFTCAFTQGIFIGSYVPFLVEDGILQIGRSQESELERCMKELDKTSTEKSDLTVYLNFRHLPGLSNIFLNQESQPLFQGLSQFAGYLKWEVIFNESSVNFSGNVISSDTSGHYLASMITQSPRNCELQKIIPDNGAFLSYTGVSSFEEYLTHVKDSSILEEVGIQNFLPWVGNEWAYIILEPHDIDYSSDCMAIFSSKDQKSARILLESLLINPEDTGKREELTYRDYTIYQISIDMLLGKLFGKFYENIKMPYFLLLEDFVVLSNSNYNLKVMIDKFKSNQTLVRDIDYAAFLEDLPSSSNTYVYINTPRLFNVLMAGGSEEFKGTLEENYPIYKKFSPIGFQFSSFKDQFLTTGSLNYSSEINFKPEVIWKVTLDTAHCFGPQIIYNHRSKSNEILVQDSANTLYLITGGGKISWKRSLETPICGKVYQLDYFDNRKLQFLFNTKNKIHLIDINGKDVAHFPVRLSAPTSNALYLVDYDDNKKYRFFVACENGSIYGFEKSGKPLPNWNPKTDMGIINVPVLHFREDTKDYIVCVNNRGGLSFFNRRGELRIPKIELNSSFKNPFFLDTDTIPYKIVSTDSSGVIFTISTTGDITRQTFGSWTSHHSFGAYDLIGNSQPEYIFMDKRSLTAFNRDGSVIFKHSYPNKMSNGLNFYKPKGEEKYNVAATDRKGGKVYLYNSIGSSFDGFPMEGNSTFEISDLFISKSKVLIVTIDNYTVGAYRIE